jgi:hypothetical protein
VIPKRRPGLPAPVAASEYLGPINLEILPGVSAGTTVVDKPVPCQ